MRNKTIDYIACEGLAIALLNAFSIVNVYYLEGMSCLFRVVT